MSLHYITLKRLNFFYTKKKNYSLVVFFSLSQFYRFYAFLGYNNSVNNWINNHYLVGHYNNFAVINLYKMLNILRINFSVLLKVLLYRYASFLVINENTNKNFYHIYYKKFIFGNISYYFGNWWKGFLKNYKIFTAQKVHRRLKNYYFCFKQFPSYVFFIGQVGLQDRISSYHVNQELNVLKILNLIYIDTKESTQRITNPLLINTKSYKTHLLIMKIFFF